MSTGEASLKISLQPAAFQAGLRTLTSATTSAGRAMGRALKEPMNAGLKSVKGEIGSMFSNLKQGLATIGTLGGALAIGTFVRDALRLQQAYGNMAAQINQVAGNSETWQSVQNRIQSEVETTSQTADDLSTTFMEIFRETGSIESAQAAIHAIGLASTATGQSMQELTLATQIAMKKFEIKTPEEALARILEGTGTGGKQLNEMGGAFEMLGESARSAGLTGGAAMTTMFNLIRDVGDKAEPGLNMMFQIMKKGSSQVLMLQKEMGRGVKFDADVSALDRVRLTFMSAKGRKAAEKIFTADARIVYDKLAEPFDQAYKDATKAGLSNAAATKAGLEAFDVYIRRAASASVDFSKIQETANARMNDPKNKLDSAIEKIRLSFTSPKMLSALDRIADKLPAFADAVATIVERIINNPWESLAVVVGGKLALAFGGSVISEVVATGMKSIFARAVAVQVASTAASVATGGATALGVGGAVGVGAGAAGAGTGAVLATGAVVAGAALAAAGVGVAAGTALYKYGGLEDRQNKEFDAVRGARETLMDTSSAKTPDQINAALKQVKAAKKNLDQGSVLNSVIGVVASPFVGNKRAEVSNDLLTEQLRLTAALKTLREGAQATGQALFSIEPPNSSRGPLRPPDPNPGSRPVGG